MAKAKLHLNKEMREVIQRRKIVAAQLDLADALSTIAEKHKLSEMDVTEVAKNCFDDCFNYVLNKNRSI